MRQLLDFSEVSLTIPTTFRSSGRQFEILVLIGENIRMRQMSSRYLCDHQALPSVDVPHLAFSIP